MFQFGMKFVLKFPTPNGFAASSITLRISGLNHEIFNDTVEDDIVVITISTMGKEVFNSFRGFIPC